MTPKGNAKMEIVKKWYVYQLIDPRTMLPFYIGKGSGKRIDAHEKEAARGVCSRKCKLINELLSSNLNVIKEKIAFFRDEADAYAFEKQEIERIGLDNLTNIIPGGKWSYSQVRSYVNNKRREDTFTPDRCVEAIVLAKDMFAEWLRNYGKKAEVIVSGACVFDSFRKKAFEFFYNGYADKVFSMAVSKQENKEKLAALFLPYNIRLVFD